MANPDNSLVGARVPGNALVRRYGKGSVQIDDPRDQALLDLVQERRLRWAADQGRGLVAGTVNPFGLTGLGARGVAHVAPWLLSPDTASGFSDTLNRWDHNAPGAAALGTFMGAPGAGTAVGLARLMRFDPRQALYFPSSLGHTMSEVRDNRARGRERIMTDDERGREYGAAGY